MANLKNLDKEELLKTIERARAQAVYDVEQAAVKARADVDAVIGAQRAGVPGLLDLTTRADIAFVAERTYGREYGTRSTEPRHTQFMIQTDGTSPVLLGQTLVTPRQVPSALLRDSHRRRINPPPYATTPRRRTLCLTRN